MVNGKLFPDGPAPADFKVITNSSNAAVVIASPLNIRNENTERPILLTVRKVKVKTVVTITVGGKSVTFTVMP